MTTELALRIIKGSPLTHEEVDANFTNLRTTADTAADDIASIQVDIETIADKANASAVGIASTDTTMGAYTSPTLADNQTAKQNIEQIAGAHDTLVSGLASSSSSTLIYGLREKIIGDRTYYVRTDGSDSNSGLSNGSGGAFLTIQKAIDTAYRTIDLNGNSVIIRVATGTYTGTMKVMGVMAGQNSSAARPLQIIGDETTPGNVIIHVTGDDAVEASNHAHVYLAGCTLKTTGTGRGIYTENHAIIETQNVVWDDCHHEMILAAHGSIIRATGPLSFLGDAESWVHATSGALVDFSSQNITFAANNFSVYAIGLNDATLKLDSATGLGTKIATGDVLIHNGSGLNVSSWSGVPYWGDTAPVVDQNSMIHDNLLEARTIYVRPGGSLIGNGLVNSDAYAFSTIQAAVNWLSRQPFDPAFWANSGDLSDGWTINVANGTYAETVTLKDIAPIGCKIVGNEGSPGSVVVQGVTDGFSATGLNTKWFIRGMAIVANGGSVLSAIQGSQITFRNVNFSAATSAQLLARDGGRIIADGNYGIENNAAYHAYARTGGIVEISGRTVTLSGTPAFSTAFAYAESVSSIRAVGNTFSGTGATGKRYDARSNAVIDVNGGGASYFPGNSAGSTATGGQYI